MKEFKTKKVTVTMTENEQDLARLIAIQILGKENISGLFSYWIRQYSRHLKDDILKERMYHE
jgi:hypothetical protein